IGAMPSENPRCRWVRKEKRFVSEYERMTASARGLSARHRRLSRPAAVTNTATERAKSATARPRLSRPDGSGRPDVLGFIASKRRSAILLNVIAAVLAATIASVIR